jgi:hypothetical protein
VITCKTNFHVFFLTGPIPESIGQLQSLTGLYLYKNELSGELINIFGTSPVTSRVHCASNFPSFSSFDFYFLHAGPIPESIGQLQSLVGVTLYSNKLSGAFTNISSGVWDVAPSDVPCDFASQFVRPPLATCVVCV